MAHMVAIDSAFPGSAVVIPGDASNDGEDKMKLKIETKKHSLELIKLCHMDERTLLTLVCSRCSSGYVTVVHKSEPNDDGQSEKNLAEALANATASSEFDSCSIKP